MAKRSRHRQEQRPRLARGVELVGELAGSGFEEPQWLARRDGRYIQLSELLFRIAAEANGRRGIRRVAERVSRAMDVRVTSAQVANLIDTHLVRVGVIEGPESGAAAPPARRASLLGLTAKKRVLGPELANDVADVLKVLYAPLLLPVLVTAAVAAQVWFYLFADVQDSLAQLIYYPYLLLPVLAIYFVSAGFHELGHAAALRYGGGLVRGMGVGIFLVFPAFYTDVTDSYRLPKLDRVRTGLGGIYFHLILSAALVGVFAASGAQFLAASVLLINAEMIRQFFPFVRLDGYWILADLTGIPDLFTQMGTSAKRMTGRGGPSLRPWVKRVFVVYMLLVIPTLAALVVVVLLSVPWILTTTIDSSSARLTAAWTAALSGDVLQTVWLVLQTALGALPLLGIAYFATSAGRRLIEALVRWFAGGHRSAPSTIAAD